MYVRQLSDEYALWRLCNGLVHILICADIDIIYIHFNDFLYIWRQYNDLLLTLKVRNTILEFVYDLGADEETLRLPYLNVSDGIWHAVTIRRQGNQLFLFVDGGDGRYYSESVPADRHRLISLDDQFIFAGSDVIYMKYHPDPYPRSSLAESKTLNLTSLLSQTYIRIFHACNDFTSKTYIRIFHVCNDFTSETYIRIVHACNNFTS